MRKSTQLVCLSILSISLMAIAGKAYTKVDTNKSTKSQQPISPVDADESNPIAEPPLPMDPEKQAKLDKEIAEYTPPKANSMIDALIVDTLGDVAIGGSTAYARLDVRMLGRADNAIVAKNDHPNQSTIFVHHLGNGNAFYAQTDISNAIYAKNNSGSASYPTIYAHASGANTVNPVYFAKSEGSNTLFKGYANNAHGLLITNNATSNIATARIIANGESNAIYAKNDTTGDVTPTIYVESAGESSAIYATSTNTWSGNKPTIHTVSNTSGYGILAEATYKAGFTFPIIAAIGRGTGHYGKVFEASSEGDAEAIFAFTHNNYSIRGSNTSNSKATVYAKNYGSGYAFYSASGGYGPFTGAHDVLFRDQSTVKFERGMLVKMTGEAVAKTNQDGQKSISDSLPVVELASLANDKRVLGAFRFAHTEANDEHWYELAENEELGIVNAVGEGRLWVTNIGGAIEVGDFITSSAVPGYGMKQDSTFFQNFTVAKAMETIDWSQVTETVKHNGRIYKRYLVAVIYMAG